MVIIHYHQRDPDTPNTIKLFAMAFIVDRYDCVIGRVMYGHHLTHHNSSDLPYDMTTAVTITIINFTTAIIVISTDVYATNNAGRRRQRSLFLFN